MRKKFNRKGGYAQPKATAFRSGLEENIASFLLKCNVQYLYETHQVPYTIPESKHVYNPDFILPNGIIVEGKGLFEPTDRKKHLLIKAQYPGLDIRFVFSNPSQKIYKGSPTTYAKWCDKYGFKYAKKLIPMEWLAEPTRTTVGLRAKKVKET